MPAFKFKMSQRVSLPNAAGVQAIVVGQTHHVDGKNSYAIRWLMDDGETAIEFLSESKLADGQPAPVDPVDQVVVTAKIEAKLPANEFNPARRSPSKRKLRR